MDAGEQGPTVNSFIHGPAELSAASRVWTSGEVLKPSWIDIRQ